MNADNSHSGSAVPSGFSDVLEVWSDGEEGAIEPAIVHFQYLFGSCTWNELANLSIDPTQRNDVISTQGIGIGVQAVIHIVIEDRKSCKGIRGS